MSFKDILFGSEGTPATVQDVRTNEDKWLRNTSADIISNLIRNPGGVWGYHGWQGPFAAPLTGAEAAGLDRINQFVTGAGTQSVNEALRTLAGMTGQNAMSPLVSDPGLGNAGMTLANRILTGQTATPGSDALLDAAIRTAQRPLMQQFEDVLANTTSDFTKAGQFVQPNSSSPFELAKAKLQTGLANAMGDVATNISYTNLAQERQRQSDLLSQQIAAVESGKNRQLQAATATPAVNRGILDSLVETLRVNALPRMIEQSGIDAGVADFNTQRQQLLALLAAAFGGTSPMPVSVPGTEGGGGLLGPILSGVGTAIGGPVGSAIGGKVAGFLT